MNILIADDESAACEHLSGLIESLPGCYDVGHAANGIEAVYKAYNLDIDIVLMDIRMPRMNGLEAARHINEFNRPPAVIFTTAYSEHALDAFDVHASGFLLKPVQPGRLVSVLSYLQHHSGHWVSEPAPFDGVEDNYVCCRIIRGLRLIALNRVIYLESSDKCTIIHHLDGYSVSGQPLKVFEQRFSNRLLRVHRSALVNKSHLVGLEHRGNGTAYAVLRDTGKRLEISRRNLSHIRGYLHSFMKPRVAIRFREQFLVQYNDLEEGKGEE